VQEWKNTPKKLFKLSNEQIAGNFKKYKNFNFVLIYGAGHLLPAD